MAIWMGSEESSRSYRQEIGRRRSVTIKNYVRDMSLENIKTNEAYKVDAAHIYVDIVNLDGILGTTATEGVTSHKRALRFLTSITAL